MTLYRQYDQAALDAQYNARARVPDHAAHFERWGRESEAARRDLECRLDLAYGDGDGQNLDFFPAAVAAGGAPVLAFIHGGYWRALDKGVFSYLAPTYVEAGIAFVAIGYPLAPAVGLDHIVASVRAAVAWLWRHAAELGCDPARLHVAGHSAGGHLTAMAMAADWAAADGLPAQLVRGGCGISGLYDLEPIRLTYLNEDLGMDETTARRNSPLHNLDHAAGRLILTAGGDESGEFHRQKAEFAAAWRGRGMACDEVAAEGRNHFTVLDDLAAPGSPLHRAVRDQIYS